MQNSEFSRTQTDAFCRLLEGVLIDLCSLLREGRHRQALDLADATHNLPSAILSVAHRSGVLSDLRWYVEKYADASPLSPGSCRYDLEFQEILGIESGEAETAAGQTGPGFQDPSAGRESQSAPESAEGPSRLGEQAPGCTRVRAPAPGDPEEAWVRVHHPDGTVALLAPPPSVEPEGRRLYFALAAGAEIEEVDALIAPFLALEFPDLPAAVAFARGAVHNAVSVYNHEMLHGDYAGGEEA